MVARDRAARVRRWALVGLLIYALAVLIVVLAPVSYGDLIAGVARILRGLGMGFFGSGWIEFAANILMFVPLGFLLTLLFRHPWYGTALAIVLSAGVEIAQIVIPSRQASLRDILSNGIGAALGAFLAWLIVLRRDHKRAKADAAVSTD